MGGVKPSCGMRLLTAAPAEGVLRPTNICSIMGRICWPNGVDMISEG